MNVLLLNINHWHVSAGHLQGGESKNIITINVSELSERRVNTDTLIAILFLFWPHELMEHVGGYDVMILDSYIPVDLLVLLKKW